jgi:hypothetical protein
MTNLTDYSVFWRDWISLSDYSFYPFAKVMTKLVWPVFNNPQVGEAREGEYLLDKFRGDIS